MEIRLFDMLPSTQTYLVEALKKKELFAPVAVLASEQTDGIGSRENKWEGGKGNLFFSVAVKTDDLPDDLPLASASIYFSFIMKEVLSTFDKNIWLKWPNDFYLGDEKVGGCITQKIYNNLICGIGINLKNSQNGYKALQCDIESKKVLEKYLFALEKFPKWKQIFRQYQIEFELSRRFSAHVENEKTSLEEARLEEDGSLLINGKKVFSLR